MLLTPCLCASSVLILPTLISLLMRYSFQIIIVFGWRRVPIVELFGSYAMKAKPVLSKNSVLLKKVFNAFNSLSMCIFSSHSSNPHLSFHETLIPNNHSVWMRNGSYGWGFALLVLDPILLIFVGPLMHWMSYLHAFCASCISLYALLLFWSYFYVLVSCE